MIKEFVCEFCQSIFERNVTPSRGGYHFCSPSCRNKARTLEKIPCPQCGTLFAPRKGKDSIRRKFCTQECAWSSQIKATSPYGQKRWNDNRDNFLREFYPERGAEYCAKILGISHGTVLSRISILGITLTKKATHKIVHSRAAQHMRNHNPMYNPHSREKVKRYWKNHPDERDKIMAALKEGQRRLQKGKPTKLELKLFSILNDAGVSHEPFCAVKSKFIVDVRIGNLIIQADGEYWHGHPRFTPLTSRQVVQQKRDRAQDTYLRACGFAVERVWERDVTTENIRNILLRHGIPTKSEIAE